VLHGGPGSGSTPILRRFFDPAAYRIVQFDQRGCGRSSPHANDITTDLSVNTTAHLLRDIEQLRVHLAVEQWLVFGGSWGSTLALAYAQEHPARVSELVLTGVATTTRAEIEWLTRGLGPVFPDAWARFCEGVPPKERAGNLAAAYARRLRDPSRAVRERAACAWCAWEDAIVMMTPDDPPNPRYANPAFRMAFARIVTHYFAHAAWLAEGQLLANVDRLANTPGVMVHGEADLGSPLATAAALARAWPAGELVVIPGEGHSAVAPGIATALVAATDRFAAG
jgi:proline iminopeptidase